MTSANLTVGFDDQSQQNRAQMGHESISVRVLTVYPIAGNSVHGYTQLLYILAIIRTGLNFVANQ